MDERTIYITQEDMDELQELVLEARRGRTLAAAELDRLEAELNRATIISGREVPPNVVTMNSRVRLTDLESQEDIVYTLVFPKEADISQGRISVLAPLGMAMLGYRAGDVFEWEVPAGTQTWRVAEILYQPEAAGND